MTHRHEFETYLRPAASPEAEELGISAVELARCRTCGEEMVYALVRGRLLPLLKLEEAGEQDILLA